MRRLVKYFKPVVAGCLRQSLLRSSAARANSLVRKGVVLRLPRTLGVTAYGSLERLGLELSGLEFLIYLRPATVAFPLSPCLPAEVDSRERAGLTPSGLLKYVKLGVAKLFASAASAQQRGASK